MRASSHTKTDEILISMLKERTAHHFLDSGDYYGRAYQRNQRRNFLKEPEAFLYVSENEISFSLNTFHFLREKLRFAGRMQWRFNKFEKRPENQDKYWHDVIQDFIRHIGGKYLGGRNSASGEDALDQVIQYDEFEYDGDEYIALQIHGGCDLRGSYSMPKIFTFDGFHEVGELYNNDRGTIYCDSGGHYWDLECAGYYSYPGPGVKPLKDYPFLEISSEIYQAAIKDSKALVKACRLQLELFGKRSAKEKARSYALQQVPEFTSDPPSPAALHAVLVAKLLGADTQYTYLFYDENNHGYCPHCAAKLKGGM